MEGPTAPHLLAVPVCKMDDTLHLKGSKVNIVRLPVCGHGKPTFADAVKLPIGGSQVPTNAHSVQVAAVGNSGRLCDNSQLTGRYPGSTVRISPEKSSLSALEEAARAADAGPMEIECREGLASGWLGTVERSIADHSARAERRWLEKMLRSEAPKKPEEQICSAIVDAK